MGFSIAALTMCAPSDAVYLDLWLAHYARQLGGLSHLHVIIDGPAPDLRRAADGASVLALPVRPGDTAFEKRRWWMLQQFAEILGTRYDAVIVGDVDELIVPAPNASGSLIELVADQPRELGHISPLGFELIQMPEETAPLDPTRPILDQRRFGRLNSKYAKPSILLNPFARQLKPGGHIWHDGPWNISPELMLFHLKAVDETLSREIAASRAQRVADLEAAGATIQDHGVRGWQAGEEQIDNMQAWMTSQESGPLPFASADIAALTNTWNKRRHKIKRCPSIQTGPYELGPDWRGIL